MGTLAPPLSVSCSFVIHSVGPIQSLEGIFIATRYSLVQSSPTGGVAPSLWELYRGRDLKRIPIALPNRSLDRSYSGL